MSPLVANVVPGFFSGVAFASLLLCLGLAIGIYLGRRMPSAVKSALDPQLMIELMAGMMRLTSGVASDVSQYRTVIERFAKGMSDSKTTPAVPADLVTHVMQANEQLQEKLTIAESTLARQASEINQIMNEARTDALTGLANRRAFDDEFARRLSQWKRHGTALMLVLVDVDHFKPVNDQYGHQAGDAVLKQLGKLLSAAVRDTDLVARYGGEEFAILLVDSGIEGGALTIARIQQAIASSTFRHEGVALRITASFGLAQPSASDDQKQLIARADEALYAAKHGGRNCGYFHTGTSVVPLIARTMVTSTSDTEVIENDLKSLEKQVSRAVAPSPAGFDNVCADLRRKLSEVTK